MDDEPSKKELERIPKINPRCREPPLERQIYEQFSGRGGNCWLASEYCTQCRVFYGYVVRDNDIRGGSWRYFSFDELRGLWIKGDEIVRDDLGDELPAPGKIFKVIMQGYKLRGELR